MTYRLLACVLVVSVSGCLCSGPPTGECSGTWAGVTYDKAQVDMASRVVIVRRTVCGAPELKRYEVSWKDRSLVLNASLFGGPTVFAEETHAVGPDAGTLFESFSFTPDPPTASGTLALGITGVQGRRTGTLAISSGTDALTCSFQVPYETEGVRISCGSGDSD